MPCPSSPAARPAKATIYKVVSGARHAGSQRSLMAGREGQREGERTGKGAVTGPERSPDGKPGQRPRRAPAGGCACTRVGYFTASPGFFIPSSPPLCSHHSRGTGPGFLYDSWGNIPREERLFAQNPTANWWQRQARTRDGGHRGMDSGGFAGRTKSPSPSSDPAQRSLGQDPPGTPPLLEGTQEVLWDSNFPGLQRPPTYPSPRRWPCRL